MITVSVEVPIPLLDFIKNYLKEKSCVTCSLDKECSNHKPNNGYCVYVLDQINSYLDEGEIDNAN